MTLYLQPTQDLTIDAETGPTEYRVSLEGVDSAPITQWMSKLVASLRDAPQVRNVSSDAGAQGLAAYIDVDRDTASRLGITASAVDDALYSAFGQRIVSTIFTETNQYRVILEAQPGLATNAEDARPAEPDIEQRPADAAVGLRDDHRAARAAADHPRRRSTRRAR